MSKKEVWDINYKNIILFVNGCYSPEEERVDYYKDGSGYPGCAEEFEIIDVLCGGQSIYDLLSCKQLEEIEIEILKKHYDHEY